MSAPEAAGSTPAERLRWVRKNKTKFRSGAAAARAYGWTVSTYMSHENGQRTPSREAAQRYAAAFRVPWHWIFEGGDRPEASVIVDPAVHRVRAMIRNAPSWDFKSDPGRLAKIIRGEADVIDPPSKLSSHHPTILRANALRAAAELIEALAETAAPVLRSDCAVPLGASRRPSEPRSPARKS